MKSFVLPFDAPVLATKQQYLFSKPYGGGETGLAQLWYCLELRVTSASAERFDRIPVSHEPKKLLFVFLQ
ncbi:hypothetical protein DP115_16315 [Brasilonema octagenarum UFV-OR1]|uniref:Uncharacterized protein n=1 Tax=Brasilonema octagenarum UFV-OR1 TaxID=417115 RepID=A0ABX1M6S6_9CYAN|nr:hypothetical protein [Brasilonema octagenarum UFV-OR1]